ncbi:reverse transcriptase [Phytophthora megakarya]|uniref:Reverse transcriptase n=1 Tax=Phytophthora megakarya TaxID=4795 RepID=A0A225WH24_9STRA|nr:reverse transcriptase [Phytophthora megakarya]
MGIQYAMGIALLDYFIRMALTQSSLWNSDSAMENVMDGGLHINQGRTSVAQAQSTKSSLGVVFLLRSRRVQKSRSHWDPGWSKSREFWVANTGEGFLGSLNYYHKFIEDYPVIAASLYERSDDQRFVLNKAVVVFLKRKIVATPVLRHPDRSKPFVIIPHANPWAACAVMGQEHGG